VRETRRVCARDPVSAVDVRMGRRRDDEVAVSTWPIELWQDHRRARFEHPAGPCSIPLAALISRSHPRLAMAGRCLGADREALGALRVLGAALATGEAAGIAAALAADAGTPLARVAAERVRHHILERASAAGDSGRS
jgi:FAD-dependent oxidoreductase family protein